MVNRQLKYIYAIKPMPLDKLNGCVIDYIDPTEPVANHDWDVLS